MARASLVNSGVLPNSVTLASKAEQRGGVAYKQRRLLYWNVGGRFIDVSAAAGPAVGAARSSRGSAAGDLDDDGRLEIVVSNIGDRPSILKNLGPTRHWLLVECVGTRANRDAIGARVWVSTGGRRLSGEVQGASSYLSQNDHRLHFGLSDASRYDGIEVLWPGGRREVFPAGDADRTVALVEGKGRAP